MNSRTDTDKFKEMYRKIKNRNAKYDEEIHCPMIIKVMATKGRYSAFCVEAMISERRFYDWTKNHELFSESYEFGKMLAREAWEELGEEIKDHATPMGTMNHAFEHWRLIGWSRFGISKNSRIRLDLNPDDSPAQHYAQLLKQASDGYFTAGEIKQLMEAVNVGLNTHQVFELQKQIDELKSDLKTMSENTNVKNTFTNKGTA